MSTSTKQSNQGGHGHDVDASGDLGVPVSRRRITQQRRRTCLPARQPKAGGKEGRSQAAPQAEKTGAAGDNRTDDSGRGHGRNSDSQQQRSPSPTPRKPQAERTGATGNDSGDDSKGSQDSELYCSARWEDQAEKTAASREHSDGDSESDRGHSRDNAQQRGSCHPEDWAAAKRHLRKLEADNVAMKRRLHNLEAGNVANRPDPENSSLLADTINGGGSSRGGAMGNGFADGGNATSVNRGSLASHATVALRLLGHSMRTQQIDLDTGTIYSYVVTVAVDASRSKAWKWFVACLSLLLVFAQGVTLGALMYEAIWPPCNAITDCPAGTFCHIYYGARPACADCGINDWLGACDNKYCDHNGNIIPYGYTLEDYLEGAFHLKFNQWSNMTEYQETCSAVIPAHIWEQQDYFDADYSQLPLTGSKAEWMRRRGRLPDRNGEYEWHDEELNTKKEYEDSFNKYLCLAANHCIQTDMDIDTNFRGHCDYATQNRQNMDVANWFVMLFLTLLWIVPICLDVEEASLEEVVLDFYLKRQLNVPAELLRIALRIRRFALPYLTTCATGLLLVTEDMTAKNIILNFLAITFIIEADNMFAILFLGSNHLERMASVANNVDEAAKKTAWSTFFWTRAQGLVCAIMLIISPFVFETQQCGEGIYGATFYTVLIVALTILVRFFCIICAKSTNQTHRQRILVTLIDTCQSILALLTGFFIPYYTILFVKNWDDEYRVWSCTISYLASLVGFLLIIGLCAMRQKYYGGDENASR